MRQGEAAVNKDTRFVISAKAIFQSSPAKVQPGAPVSDPARAKPMSRAGSETGAPSKQRACAEA